MTTRGNSTVIRRKCFAYWRYLTPRGWRMRCQCGCNVEFNPADVKWEADHEHLHTYDGSDDPPNVRPLIYRCHKAKSGKDKTFIAKGQRQSDSVYGVKRSRRPMMGSIASGWKRKFNGDWERR